MKKRRHRLALAVRASIAAELSRPWPGKAALPARIVFWAIAPAYMAAMLLGLIPATNLLDRETFWICVGVDVACMCLLAFLDIRRSLRRARATLDENGPALQALEAREQARSLASGLPAAPPAPGGPGRRL